MTPEQQVRQAVAKLPNVRFEKGWNDPRIAGRGTWAPRFVMLHHTAGTKSLGTLTRTAWPPVRGAHFLIDRDGLVRVLSSSKAYHAGKGGPRFGVAAGMMNAYAWGIEIEDLGKGQTMTPAQIDSAAALTAGLLDAMGADLDAVIQHKEWNPRSKVDTRYSTSFWRDKVAAELAPPKLTQSSTRGDAVRGHREYTGKVTEAAEIPVDDRWHDIPGFAPFKGSPFTRPDETHSLYLRILPEWAPPAEGEPVGDLIVEVRYVRANGDATAHDQEQYGPGTASIPLRAFHEEYGEKGVGGRWQVKAYGGATRVRLSTRYAKLRAFDVDWVA